ncbi:MAG: nuclear transport factor 2 family protein [Candidatus Roseilinea sp.]|uniref:nuclear transport factor 2 family protein n=1 Tax=Candidatus Roseilinea sp. TaxID=2838777 RepID=UPI0040493198
MSDAEQQIIWDTLRRHLTAIFSGDPETYAATTSEDLSLYEWYITPHRQDGLDFHLFLVSHASLPPGHEARYDLLEPRLQVYNDSSGAPAVAIASYTLMLTRMTPEGVSHRSHNESRVLIRRDGVWTVVHVHKSPAWAAPFGPE